LLCFVPGRVTGRLDGFNFGRLTCDTSDVSERVQFAIGARLDEHVAKDRGLHRTGVDGKFAGVRRKLIQQAIAGSAPHDIHRANVMAGELGERIEDSGILHRETFEHAADDFAFTDGDGLSGLPTELSDRGTHVVRTEKRDVIGINQATKGRCTFGSEHEGGVIAGAAIFRKRAPALLHQPEPMIFLSNR